MTWSRFRSLFGCNAAQVGPREPKPEPKEPKLETVTAATASTIHSVLHPKEDGETNIGILIADLDRMGNDQNVKSLISIAREQNLPFGLHLINLGINDSMINSDGKTTNAHNRSIGLITANHFAYNMLPSEHLPGIVPWVLLDIPTGAYRVLQVMM